MLMERAGASQQDARAVRSVEQFGGFAVTLDRRDHAIEGRAAAVRSGEASPDAHRAASAADDSPGLLAGVGLNADNVELSVGDDIAIRTISPAKNSGDTATAGFLALGARDQDFPHATVVEHPQAEAAVLFVSDQDLNRVRAGPGQTLQPSQQPVPVVSPELDNPGKTGPRANRSGEQILTDLREALMPLPVRIGPSKRLHDMLGVLGDDDDLGESAHGGQV